MTPHEYRRIEIHLIDIPQNRLRGVKPHRVETLSKDIAVNGQLQPILVTEKADGRFVLTKGLQRLQAIKASEMGEIDARVTPAAWLNAQQVRLQEIMATLNREDYTALERCEALAELKVVYEELHPDTRKGVAGGKARQGSANEIFSFAQTAADATGLSRRSIELAVAMWNGLSTTTRVRLRGSWIETKQSELRALSEASANIQAAVLDLLFSTPPKAGSVADAVTLAEGRKLADPTEKAYRAVLDKWQRFPIGQKRSFVTQYRDEILRLLNEERV